jgi:hypothetical protein
VAVSWVVFWAGRLIQAVSGRSRIFGVPTVQVEQRLFWGLDALEMVAASLRGDPWFDAGGGWDQAAAPRPGLQRAG